MSNPLPTALISSILEPKTAEEIATLRKQLIGTKVPIPPLALALGVSERSIYNLIDQYHIPFVKLLNKRFVEPADIKAAMKTH